MNKLSGKNGKIVNFLHSEAEKRRHSGRIGALRQALDNLRIKEGDSTLNIHRKYIIIHLLFTELVKLNKEYEK